MAIYRPSPLIGSISGNLGGANFLATFSRHIVRRRPSKTNKRSTAQLAQRAAFHTLAAHWQTLGHHKQRTWHLARHNMPYRNRLGLSTKMTAFNLYMKTNLCFASHMQFVDAYAPAVLFPYNLMTLELDFTEGGPFNVTRVPAPVPPNRTRAYRITQTITSNPRQIQHHWQNLFKHDTGLETTDIYNQWIAALPEPRAGEHLQVEIQEWTTDAWPSLRTNAFTAVKP